MSIKVSQMELKRHEFFEDIIAHLNILFTDELGFSQDIAEQAGISVVHFMIAHWAGQNLGIPIDYKYRVAKRDLEIYEFHRGDFSATARQFGLTERGARKALERVYKHIADKNQGKLF